MAENIHLLNKKAWKNFDRLAEVVDSPMILLAIHHDATALRNDVKAKAPSGPTGNLKNAVVAKKFRQQRKGNPAAYVAIDYRKGPHAHLVEFGTHGWRSVKKKQVLYDKETGEFFGIEVAPMPANPFFRPAVDCFSRMVHTERMLHDLIGRGAAT